MYQGKSLEGTHCVVPTGLLNFIFISPRVKTLGYDNLVPTGLKYINNNSKYKLRKLT